MLDNGGPERWLVDLCQAGRAGNVDMDIVVLWQINGLFREKARERGVTVYHCPPNNPLKFVSALRRLLREHGPYDAIHSHVHAFGCFVVLAARLEGVPVRVIHSHNVLNNSAGPWKRRLYIAFARMLNGMFATAGLAPSAASAEDLFGPDWRADPRWGVLPCGIDLVPFRAALPAASLRAALGIPQDALVLASVGRLTHEKNSGFLVDILASVLRLRSDAYLLLIGEGPLRKELEQKAREGGYGDHLVMPGVRGDVATLMRSVFDVFLFPSPPPPRGNEALPIAMVEAQAAGLPIVASDGVPAEAILVPDLIVQLRADDSPETWAKAILAHARERNSEVVERSLASLEHSSHNCAVNVKVLSSMYRNARLSPAAALDSVMSGIA